MLPEHPNKGLKMYKGATGNRRLLHGKNKKARRWRQRHYILSDTVVVVTQGVLRSKELVSMTPSSSSADIV